jgi:hypothetical protein
MPQRSICRFVEGPVLHLFCVVHPQAPMNQREIIRLRIVQMQQRLLSGRHDWLSCPDKRQDLQRVRQANHAALQMRFAALLSRPESRRAAEFFFGQLYPLEDGLWRDEQLSRTVPRMCKVMPLAACTVLEQAVALDMLTFELDCAMAAGQVPDQDWLQASRQQQLQAVLVLGAGLAQVTRVPLMVWLLRCAAPLARRKNLGELQDFFTSGLDAFSSLPDPHDVLNRIRLTAFQSM